MTGITAWLEFIEQWDPKSPWHDRRVRLAANLAIDKQAISEAAGLGFDRPTGSILPRALEIALPLEPFPYDPAQAKRLLAEAGYPQGFHAGDLTPFPPVLRVAEAVGMSGAVGIRTQLRTLERAAVSRLGGRKSSRGLCWLTQRFSATRPTGSFFRTHMSPPFRPLTPHPCGSTNWFGKTALREVLWITARHTREGCGSESSQSYGSRRPAA